MNILELKTRSVQGALQAVAQGGSLMDGFTAYAEATMFLDPTTLAFMAAAYMIQEFLLSGELQPGRPGDRHNGRGGPVPQPGHVLHGQVAPGRVRPESRGVLLLQLQARPHYTGTGPATLKSFNPNPWGVASDDGPANADCRGFTSTEFQMLDFSKMDLSEYFGDIATQVQSTIQQNVSGKINSYYNSIQQQP